jgi:hypothetical protein
VSGEAKQGDSVTARKKKAAEPRSARPRIDPKDKGAPANHKKKSQPAAANRATAPPTVPPETRARRPRLPAVQIGDGHPWVETGTFNAAALLASVLAAVEPRLSERLGALTEAASAEGADTSEIDRAIRAAGRQIADAVRAGVVDGMRVRDQHLAQLVVIDRATVHANTLKALRYRIEKELSLAGLRRVSDLSDLSPFNLAASEDRPTGPPAADQRYELVSPAYVDTQTGRTVERGWIRPATTTATTQQAPSPAGTPPPGAAKQRSLAAVERPAAARDGGGTGRRTT